MKRTGKKLTLIFLLFFIISCGENSERNALFEAFQNPPADARPMVRWWWNGNCVEADEIKRELTLLKEAGIGGVEINSIAMPVHAKETNAKPLQWAGKAWCEMVKTASQKAGELGMITDLIVGSGWPFGGQFLSEDETIQRLSIKREPVKANSLLTIDLNTYLDLNSRDPGETKRKVSLVSVKLIPADLNSLDEVIDLTSEIQDNRLNWQAPNRDYVLTIVFTEQNFRSVSVGSPGADGPVMDHFKTEAVRGYLNRLKVLEKETGLTLSELVRALFCDSIELGGANWTDDMEEQFFIRNGYDISPWLPFVIQPYNNSNHYEASAEMKDQIRRVQYDFYNTVIAVFLERFTQEFQKFCTENNVLCRYQAYGHPFYMGIFQGNMIPDIPESNNWIYSRGRDEAGDPEYTWVQNHGYMLWNKAASSGAHITGKPITSCEAMTNTAGVFRTSLETVKQSDDMNFITGINHSVLHGFNYSPPEAGFPGWIRFGAYFSEQNTWWPYFKKWTDYNARLSAVFQNTKPVADIAVLGRLRDIWGEHGLDRTRLNDNPWYYARLWEPVSNLGSSCDYIHQPVLETAKVEGNELVCGEMGYKAIILTGVESMTPAAARKLRDFAVAGGKVAFIGITPSRSLAFTNPGENDRIVRDAVQKAVAQENVLEVAEPSESEDFIAWTRQLFEKMNFDSQVKISAPVSHLYSMMKKNSEQEVFFFANAHREKAVEFDAIFPAGNKHPYIWLPATGERFSLQPDGKNRLHLKLQPLESALIVFEPVKIDLPVYEFPTWGTRGREMNTSWEVTFEQVNGEVFHRKMERLIDFKTSDDEAIRTFSGVVNYSGTFVNPGDIRYLTLSNVNEGVSELFINDQPAGMRWYGMHCYDLRPYIQEGINKVDIKLTTTLANYCMSLEDNPAARAWTRNYTEPFSSGLEGVVLER